MWSLRRKKREEEQVEDDDSKGEESSSDDEDLGGAGNHSKKVRGEKPQRKQKKKDSDDEADEKKTRHKSNAEKKTPKQKVSKKEKRQEANRKKEEEETRRKEAASREVLRAKDLALQVDKEDVEQKGSTISMAQAQEYVSVPMFAVDDGPLVVNSVAKVGPSSEPVFERAGEIDTCRGRVLVPKQGGSKFGLTKSSQWKEEVYVENPATGKFTRVLYDLDEQGNRITMKKYREEESVSEFSPQRLRAMMNKMEYMLEGIFMVGQGLLAGGSLFQLIVVLQIRDPSTLLSIYGPLAKEVRRMFFFLSVLSFVGVCDKITAEKDQKKNWAERGAKERAEMYFYGMLLFCCLLFTLLAWPLVDKIFDAYELLLESPDALQGEEFESTLSMWTIFIGIRFAFAALGWLLICQDTNRDIVRGRQRFTRIERYQDEIEQNNIRLARLSGKLLDTATLSELERLSKTLATGLEEVRLQLEIRSNIPSIN